MKQKRVPVWILSACTFVSALSITASTVLGSEIESHAQISFKCQNIYLLSNSQQTR